MPSNDLSAIRWELAKRLAGMRETCYRDHPHKTYHYEHGKRANDPTCPGYQPVPLTAEGLIDEVRLRRALEVEGWWVLYDGHGWELAGVRYGQIGYDSNLAVAYLKAVGAWPVKEGENANL